MAGSRDFMIRPELFKHRSAAIDSIVKEEIQVHDFCARTNADWEYLYVLPLVQNGNFRCVRGASRVWFKANVCTALGRELQLDKSLPEINTHIYKRLCAVGLKVVSETVEKRRHPPL